MEQIDKKILVLNLEVSKNVKDIVKAFQNSAIYNIKEEHYLQNVYYLVVYKSYPIENNTQKTLLAV